MKKLNKSVIKTELTNKNVFEINTKHIKKEELISGTIKIKMMRRIIEGSIMIIVKAIIGILTSSILTEINS